MMDNTHSVETDSVLLSSLWNFLYWDSIWPLPHVMLAYHAYLYTRNWISVLCFYYVIKTLQLVLFSLMGLDYDHFFSEILTSTAKNSEILVGNSTYVKSFTQPEYSCIVDFNGLFVGGTLQTLLGIMLGMVHACAYASDIHSEANFHPVSFWKRSATKRNAKFIAAKMFLNRKEYRKNLCSKYGLWPWRLWFGCGLRSGLLWRAKHSKNNYNIDFTNSEQDQHLIEYNEALYYRWRFRKVFWQRWLQLTLLGTPCLVFYTMGDENLLRAGSVAYGFITCSLLLWYRVWNEAHFIKVLTKHFEQRIVNRIENSASSGDMETVNQIILINTIKYNIKLIFNSYDTIYSVWILTSITLIGFQAVRVPQLIGFYKVIVSSVIMMSMSALVYKWPSLRRVLVWLKQKIDLCHHATVKHVD